MKANGEARPASTQRHRWHTGIAGAAVALLSTGAMVAANPAPAAAVTAAATVDTTAWYVLINRASGKALDVYGASTSDGARIIQWTRTDGNNQQWQFVDSGDGYYRLKARHSSKVLNVADPSTADNSAVVQWADTNGTVQQFRLADSDAGYVRLISRNSGKAVEAQGASTADNASIVQNADTGGSHQQWQPIKLSGGNDPGGNPGAGCGKNPTLTSGSRTIQSNGRTRNFILRIPDNYDRNHPYRLVFGFHWNGGTANDVDSGGTSGYTWSYYGLREQANNSTVFVAPQGNGNGWANPGGEDTTFVDDMIKQIENDLCINTTQRFALGFSYGGGMSYALACARATVFRAVAVYSGGQLSGCSGGTQPIAYMGLHGLRDPVLNISTGRSLRDTFVRNNGCTAQNPAEPAQGSLTHKVTAYSGCRAGYPVVWAAFDAGHTPAPVDGSTADSGGGDRTWTKGEVWRFFTQFQ